jgi:hypothetical protein
MLSVRAFWRELSRRQFHLGAVAGVPETLSYAALLDQLFGRLTRHRLIALGDEWIAIDCSHCDRAREVSGNDVCETHIGILEGQFGRRFGHSFTTERSIAGAICQLRLYSKAPPP